MTDLLSALPSAFRTVRYAGECIPGDGNDLGAGANCQRYAYAALQHFGLVVPPWRSSELWQDALISRRVSEPFETLDLLLFGRTSDAYGAHVGVYAGEGRVLHLAKSVGEPSQWTLSQFAERPEYRVMIGGKRFVRSVLT